MNKRVFSLPHFSLKFLPLYTKPVRPFFLFARLFARPPDYQVVSVKAKVIVVRPSFYSTLRPSTTLIPSVHPKPFLAGRNKDGERLIPALLS